MTGLGDDFYDVAIAQLVPQWDDSSVYLCADTGVTHFGMNVIGKVDAGCIARQNDDFPFRRECVDLFGIEIDLERGEKFVGVGDVALPLHYLPQP